MSSKYVYSEIGENNIRLFSLLPATSQDAELECEIQIHKRDDAPKYEAVSYVWGQSDGIALLKVHEPAQDRCSGSRHFLIGFNLAAALKRFRSKQVPRLLWSDAICIDQDSKIELSQQVPLMENIYSHATRVLVWLGNSTETSTKAFSFMEKMLSMGTNFDDLVKGPYASEWTAVESLMRMPWFTRRWIVQEIALAKDASIYCGEDEISWRDFCDSVALFGLYYQEIKALFLNETYNYSRNCLGEVEALGACRLVHITSNLFRKSADGTILRRLMTLEGLVSTLTMFNAAKPHDTIYAMVAIAKDIKTVAQNKNSVERGAFPVSTPRDEDFHELEPPRKMIRTSRKGRGATRFQRATEEIIYRNGRPVSLHDDENRPRKGAARLQAAVRDLKMGGALPDKFRVDYDQSFLRVCMDFVGFAIMQSHSLDIICRPWVPEELKVQYDLPSWLMDADACPFRPQRDGTFVRVNADPLVGQNAMEAKRYSASGSMSQARRVKREAPEDGWGFGYFDRESRFEDLGREHRSLFVSGFVLDTIDDIKDKAEDGTIPNEWFAFADWQDRSSLPPDPFWRTLVADRESDGSYVGSYYQRTLRDTMQQYGARKSAFNVKAILATPQCDRRSEKVLNRILAVTPNRRLFKTSPKTGRLLGLAPAKAKERDLVCILYGCSVPVILREQSAQIEGDICRYYEFIGDAYLHGLMEGDALDEQNKLQIPPQQFELR